MRFRHPDGSTVHLAYCTNVHPAETLDGVLAQLRDHCEPVRRRLGRDRLGIGLWLAKDAAHALVSNPDWADPERLDHTSALARVLAGLLPDDVTQGSISPLPLAWRTAYGDG